MLGYINGNQYSTTIPHHLYEIYCNFWEGAYTKVLDLEQWFNHTQASQTWSSGIWLVQFTSMDDSTTI